MQQSTIFVEIISNRCYGRSVKSKKPKQKTCPLCRNRYCLAMANDAGAMVAGRSHKPAVVGSSPIPATTERGTSVAEEAGGTSVAGSIPAPVSTNPPDRIAKARQRAEALLQKVTA